MSLVVVQRGEDAWRHGCTGIVEAHQQIAIEIRVSAEEPDGGFDASLPQKRQGVRERATASVVAGSADQRCDRSGVGLKTRRRHARECGTDRVSRDIPIDGLPLFEEVWGVPVGLRRAKRLGDPQRGEVALHTREALSERIGDAALDVRDQHRRAVAELRAPRRALHPLVDERQIALENRIRTGHA